MKSWLILPTVAQLLFSPAVKMLMPSFCQVIVGRGEPVALQGRVTWLFKITSSIEGCDCITGGSIKYKYRHLLNKNFCHKVTKIVKRKINVEPEMEICYM